MVVYSRWGCGRCWACRQGIENRCERPAGELGGGVGCDGGLAEYMLVPAARYLVAIDDLDPVTAAPLSDAALTPYHALKRCSHQLRPGVTVAVIGVGGIGHMAVQLLRALCTVRVVAVDTRDDALELARSAGADVTVSATGLIPAQLRGEIGARGASVVLDCVASDATLDLAAGAVSIGGEICYIGRGGGSLGVNPGRLPFECSVTLRAGAAFPSSPRWSRSHGPVRSTSRSNGDPRPDGRHLPAAAARRDPGARRRGARDGRATCRNLR